MTLMVSPTGSRHTKVDHPALPTTIPEIVATTVACAAAGADALHLHVRDALGRHSLDAGLYSEALRELDLVLPGFPVQVTTEAGGRFDPAEQRALLEKLKPGLVSASLRELARSPKDARAIYDWCADSGADLQHIIFNASDAELLRDLQTEGILGTSESVLLVLGRYGQTEPADPDALQPLLATLPPIGRWMLCAFGGTEHACLARAHALGGDMRVGFENALTQEDGRLWPSMAASVTALRNRIGQDTCRTFSHAV